MTKKEASEKYRIPMEILEEYEKWNLCGEVKKVMGAWQYDDVDLDRLGMIMTLHDIGFSNTEIEEYMHLYLKGDETVAKRMRILKQKREQTLDEIHFQEKRLEYLDYLRYKTRVSIIRQGGRKNEEADNNISNGSIDIGNRSDYGMCGRK